MKRKGYHCHEYQDPLSFATTTVVHRCWEPEDEDHVHQFLIVNPDVPIGHAPLLELKPATAWAEQEMIFVKYDKARYPNAPCDHCGAPQQMHTTVVWVSPHCCVEHQRQRPKSAGGAISILCTSCYHKLKNERAPQA